eukprot:TRINITY_DN76761_c0_g1_i1.p1 TRINITY_DN76761_c0_g1~~TRINITY_DN76761_c0_g1_i1.p1  ORF type:complete len:407 (+),score=45.03 TRINITY_DN76761_c0_g1_i1:49-1269(+)
MSIDDGLSGRELFLIKERKWVNKSRTLALIREVQSPATASDGKQKLGFGRYSKRTYKYVYEKKPRRRTDQMNYVDWSKSNDCHPAGYAGGPEKMEALKQFQKYLIMRDKFSAEADEFEETHRETNKTRITGKQAPGKSKQTKGGRDNGDRGLKRLPSDRCSRGKTQTITKKRPSGKAKQTNGGRGNGKKGLNRPPSDSSSSSSSCSSSTTSEPEGANAKDRGGGQKYKRAEDQNRIPSNSPPSLQPSSWHHPVVQNTTADIHTPALSADDLLTRLRPSTRYSNDTSPVLRHSSEGRKGSAEIPILDISSVVGQMLPRKNESACSHVAWTVHLDSLGEAYNAVYGTDKLTCHLQGPLTKMKRVVGSACFSDELLQTQVFPVFQPSSGRSSLALLNHGGTLIWNCCRR